MCGFGCCLDFFSDFFGFFRVKIYWDFYVICFNEDLNEILIGWVDLEVCFYVVFCVDVYWV